MVWPENDEQTNGVSGGAMPMLRLVLMPGLDGTGRQFSDLVAALPAGFEAAAVT
jgi:hypothetical protein